ncbi:hypothetical protein BSK71_02000 [Pectobacterium actinidiae]|uniref:Uncharacterized protein n=1 Tax=Pectobacterium actinidiae TaxID=1507808 RepID=A0A1V2RA08_9GAMM|nr:hypothetical protein BSK71_02000 [Pectobacterium actinidiae]
MDILIPGAFICFQYPDNQIQLLSPFLIKTRVDLVEPWRFTHTRKINKAKGMRLVTYLIALNTPGTPVDGIHSGGRWTEKRITQAGFASATFSHQTNNGSIMNRLIKLIANTVSDTIG